MGFRDGLGETHPTTMVRSVGLLAYGPSQHYRGNLVEFRTVAPPLSKWETSGQFTREVEGSNPGKFVGFKQNLFSVVKSLRA